MNENEYISWDQIENSPSETFLERVTRGSLWSLTVKREEEEDLSLPPLIVLEVDGEDRSSCLSRTSLIRFRSTDATSALDPTPPFSLYIITTITTPYSLFLLLWFFDSSYSIIITMMKMILVEEVRVLSFFFYFWWKLQFRFTEKEDISTMIPPLFYSWQK